MAKYNVEVVETLSKVVEIEADSYKEAEEKAEEMYDNADIVLDWEDKEDTEFKPYPPQKIKDSFVITFDFDKQERDVYIADENGSGLNYRCETTQDLKNAISTYVNDCIGYEMVKPIRERKIKESRGYER